MRRTTSMGVIGGFAALFTSTLGGSALACTHPSSGASVVMSADVVRSVSDIKLDLQPARDAARLADFSRFEHAALVALSAKAGDLAGDISTAADKDAPAKLLDRATSARTAALADLADAKASLAAADTALAAGRNLAAARLLRQAGGQLRVAAAKLGLARMLVGAAMHAAFLADKAAALAARADVVRTDVKPFGVDPAAFGHHCDGFGGADFGAGTGDRHWGHNYRYDSYHHDRYHHFWRH